MAVEPARRPFSNYVEGMCQELQVIIRENGLLRYSFGLPFAYDKRPNCLKLLVKMVDNCSIQDGCKQTNRFQGEPLAFYFLSRT